MVGDCIDDQFSVSGALGAGSPTICGTNTGYHSKFETIFLPDGTRSELHLIILTVANTGGPWIVRILGPHYCKNCTNWGTDLVLKQ